MSNKETILHLIQEDLLYHRMIYGAQKHEIHIEFYPDIASAVLKLMDLDEGAYKTQFTDIYNQYMGRTESGMSLGKLQIKALAEECYEALLL